MLRIVTKKRLEHLEEMNKFYKDKSYETFQQKEVIWSMLCCFWDLAMLDKVEYDFAPYIREYLLSIGFSQPGELLDAEVEKRLKAISTLKKDK